MLVSPHGQSSLAWNDSVISTSPELGLDSAWWLSLNNVLTLNIDKYSQIGEGVCKLLYDRTQAASFMSEWACPVGASSFQSTATTEFISIIPYTHTHTAPIHSKLACLPRGDRKGHWTIPLSSISWTFVTCKQKIFMHLLLGQLGRKQSCLQSTESEVLYFKAPFQKSTVHVNI